MTQTPRSIMGQLAIGYCVLTATLALGALAVGVVFAAATTSAASRRTQVAATAQRRVVVAADAFLATLDAAQRAKANIELNAKTRTVWSNLPSGVAMQTGATERNGLKLGDMSAAQEKAAMALVAAALSREGYEKVTAIVDADEVLEQRSAPTRQGNSRVRFGRKEFYMAILGKPGADAQWMLQFGGHHLAINVTFAGSSQVLTPTHTGAQPASYSIEGRNIRPLGDENDKAFALVNSLTPEQRKQAILGVEVRNLVLGPGEDGKMIAPEGIKGSALTVAQRAQLLELIGEWVRIVGDEASAARMADASANMGDTYFTWAGPTTNGSGAYFRIQGPTVFIEYAPQGNPASTDHIHTIYRDPTNDYASKATVR
jgi:hypothetical protein